MAAEAVESAAGEDVVAAVPESCWNGEVEKTIPESCWNGVVEKTISAPLEQVWAVASDFLSFPNLLTIEAVEGENRVAGCTRKVTNLPGRTDTDSAQWAKQKLVEINPEEHVFSYEFLENNTGVDPGYYSTFQVRIETLERGIQYGNGTTTCPGFWVLILKSLNIDYGNVTFQNSIHGRLKFPLWN